MGEKKYIPPYTISDKIVNLISEISEILTKLTIDDKMNPIPRLRRDNRVKTIHAKNAFEADRRADSGVFIEFLLQAIYDALKEIESTEQVEEQVTEQVERLLRVLNEESLSTKELMERLGLKHRPTFRNNYLLPAMKYGLVEMTIPDKPNSSRQKYRKKK